MSAARLNGQCFCGRVEYEIEKPLKFIVHDHCSICRRISGAAFVTWCGVKTQQFKILKGQDCLSSFKTTLEAERQFCNTCGSHLFFRSSKWPDEVHITLASITSELTDKVKAHVFFSDKADWLDAYDKLPKYGGPTGLEALQSKDES